jgi:APA family basic amino acid/polyamine antiporter
MTSLLKPATPGEARHEPSLRRELGLVSAIMITVGSVIGSGIFLKPLEISWKLPDTAWVHGVWAILGVVCLFGAFAYAELGAMFPEAGGQYAYLRVGWGRFVAFLYGWTLFLVINTGTLAALSAAFAETLDSVVAMPPWAERVVSIAMIVLLAVINHFGVNWGAVLQNLSTFGKLAGLGIIVAGGFFVANIVREPTPSTSPAPPLPGLLPGLVAACVAVFWAYEGWYQLPFNAAELKKPERDLPRGLIYGMFILIATYVAVNAVYHLVVPIEEMRTYQNRMDVPKTVVSRIFGSGVGESLALLVCLSVFGSANPNLLSSPRAFYAMAKDGVMPKPLMHVHPVHRTPTTAIWIQAVWAIALMLFLENFKSLTDYVVFASLIFYGLTVAAIYVLRQRIPNAPRPYRCWGYPVTPALFIAVVLFVDVNTLLDENERINALRGLAIVAAGVPVYFLLGRRRQSSALP